MLSLAAPDAYPRLLLDGRIAFRSAWSKQIDKNNTFNGRDRKFELEYDSTFNFAHMGIRYIEGDWPVKKKAKKKSNSPLSAEAMRLLVLMRAAKKKNR